MVTSDNVAALIGRIYDAALNPRVWPAVLDEIAVQFNSICGYLFIADLNADEIHFAALNEKFSFDSAEKYGSYYRYIDDRLTNLLLRPPGEAVADWQLVEPTAFRRSEFYNDFYIPHGLQWALVGLPDKDNDETVGVCIARPPKSEPFDKKEVAKAQLLFPHFARAARIMRRAGGIESIAVAGASALDRLPVGIFIVDAAGHPLFVNRAGQQIVNQSDGVKIERDGLAVSLLDETNALRRAIGTATKHGADGSDDVGGALTISRPSRQRDYQVLVAPISNDRLSLIGTRRHDLALVMVFDPAVEAIPPEQTVSQLYGLTPAEADLAMRLARGHSVKEISETTNRSENTVRWTLKNLLAKTECRRQVDLVRLLLKIPSIVPHDGDQTGSGPGSSE